VAHPKPITPQNSARSTRGSPVEVLTTPLAEMQPAVGGARDGKSETGCDQKSLAFRGAGKRRKLTCVDNASFVRSKRKFVAPKA